MVAVQNPYKLQNGSHEWKDCRRNPSNQKGEEKDLNNGYPTLRREQI
jgi:hypothetical protein